MSSSDPHLSSLDPETEGMPILNRTQSRDTSANASLSTTPAQSRRNSIHSTCSGAEETSSNHVSSSPTRPLGSFPRRVDTDQIASSEKDFISCNDEDKQRLIAMTLEGPDNAVEMVSTDDGQKEMSVQDGSRQSDQSLSSSASASISPSGAASSTGGKATSKPCALPPGVSQQTRHARRIYVGNIPPAFAEDELLRAFLNSVISKGLGEENDNSYVLSLYVNQKKCFAFVELKSIELTTACLELDGLIYHTSVLRILRANEYKPELLPPSYNPPIKLHLPANAFGTPPPSVSSALSSAQHSPTNHTSDPRLDYSFIQLCPVGAVEKGVVAIIGFPYDEGIRRTTGRAGCSIGPKAIRNAIRRVGGAGSLMNPELGIDLRSVQVVDVGDIPPGLHIDEACSRLASAIIELLHRGAIPFVLGGSSDQSYCVAAGLMAVAGGSMCAVNVSSHLDVRPVSSGNESKIHSNGTSFRQLLDDTRFCPPRNTTSSFSCDGRLVMFGTQGALCSVEHANYVTDRGGKIYWLSKDLRLSSPLQSGGSSAGSSLNDASGQISGRATAASNSAATTVHQFKKVLRGLSEHDGTNSPPYRSTAQRPIHITINAGAICGTYFPGSVRASETSLGLTADEILDMALVVGADPNVVVVDISDFVPEIEEDRSARLYADIFYRFVAGVASRHSVSLNSMSLPQSVSSAAATSAYLMSTSGRGDAQQHTSSSTSSYLATSALASSQHQRSMSTQQQSQPRFIQQSALSNQQAMMLSGNSMRASPVRAPTSFSGAAANPSVDNAVIDHNSLVYSRTSTPGIYATPADYGHVSGSASHMDNTMMGIGMAEYQQQQLHQQQQQSARYSQAMPSGTNAGGSFYESSSVRQSVPVMQTSRLMSQQQQQHQQQQPIGASDLRARLAAQIGRSVSASPYIRDNDAAPVGYRSNVRSLLGEMSTIDGMDLAINQRLKTTSLDAEMFTYTPRGGAPSDFDVNSFPYVTGNSMQQHTSSSVSSAGLEWNNQVTNAAPSGRRSFIYNNGSGSATPTHGNGGQAIPIQSAVAALAATNMPASDAAGNHFYGEDASWGL